MKPYKRFFSEISKPKPNNPVEYYNEILRPKLEKLKVPNGVKIDIQDVGVILKTSLGVLLEYLEFDPGEDWLSREQVIKFINDQSLPVDIPHASVESLVYDLNKDTRKPIIQKFQHYNRTGFVDPISGEEEEDENDINDMTDSASKIIAYIEANEEDHILESLLYKAHDETLKRQSYKRFIENYFWYVLKPWGIVGIGSSEDVNLDSICRCSFDAEYNMKLDQLQSLSNFGFTSKFINGKEMHVVHTYKKIKLPAYLDEYKQWNTTYYNNLVLEKLEKI